MIEGSVDEPHAANRNVATMATKEAEVRMITKGLLFFLHRTVNSGTVHPKEDAIPRLSSWDMAQSRSRVARTRHPFDRFDTFPLPRSLPVLRPLPGFAPLMNDPDMGHWEKFCTRRHCGRPQGIYLLKSCARRNFMVQVTITPSQTSAWRYARSGVPAPFGGLCRLAPDADSRYRRHPAAQPCTVHPSLKMLAVETPGCEAEQA